jgi:hypothetical protein
MAMATPRKSKQKVQAMTKRTRRQSQRRDLKHLMKYQMELLDT